ncbi:uncharacterized protein LOC108087437 [Drosophila ficusphila]|uniref:uncharacterized protein LOC108087437 n=1 Tax=Drosophila ficusphila TaxID=30025 RepID=UPI0007E8209C|nr:uncharacterized protein LOC108087437 [Drosophila ficusphila]
MKDQLLSLLLPILIISNWTEGKVFKINKMECSALDPSFTYFKTCQVVHRKNGRAALYVSEIFLYKEPIDNIILNLGIFKLVKNRRFQILNETLDYCVFSRQYLASGFFGFLMSPLLKTMNVNATCPLKQNITVTGFPVDENTIKEIPIPNGFYMFQLRTSMMRKWRTDVRVYVSRVEKYSE